MAGYSGTPLFQKLGIKPGFKICVKNAPDDYMRLIAPIPPAVRFLSRLGKDLDMVHFFTVSKRDLQHQIQAMKKAIKSNGMIWISWPKKAAKADTDMTEDVIRDVILPLDLVDIKVCAVDAYWSGLKLVIRKEKR
ncbi:DUF3052 domain-containing protein [Marinicella sp. W31]|uniref:DUF3052 domain-containing protein n=1 Tax=Marinicella sp. W31 TaxID=3023713 RepID=UPI0037581E88